MNWRRSTGVRAAQCVILILAVLSGIFDGMKVPFALGKGIDLSSWSSHRIMLSDSELTFRVPGGEAPSEMPEPPPRARVDVERDITSEKGGIGIFSRTWSYRGFFWQGVLGYLRLAVGVFGVPGDPMHNKADLERTIRARFEDTYRDQKRGSDLEVTVPDEYKTVTLNRREWLKYSLGGFKDSVIYATPLTATRYVVVHFDFIANSGGRDGKWRQEAEVTADKIADSLAIQRGGN